MEKVRVIYRQDGGVSVIHPAPKSKRPNETEEQWLERVFSKTMQPQYDEEGKQINPLFEMPYDDIDSSELPQTREDRDSWTGEKGEGISIDEVKAAKLRKDRKVETKINKKVREMAREMAIENLIVEGVLAEDYKD